MPSELEGLTVQDLVRDDCDMEDDGLLFINYLLDHAKLRGIPIMSSVRDANPILKTTIRMIFAALIWHLGLGKDNFV